MRTVVVAHGRLDDRGNGHRPDRISHRLCQANRWMRDAGPDDVRSGGIRGSRGYHTVRATGVLVEGWWGCHWDVVLSLHMSGKEVCSLEGFAASLHLTLKQRHCVVVRFMTPIQFVSVSSK